MRIYITRRQGYLFESIFILGIGVALDTLASRKNKIALHSICHF